MGNSLSSCGLSNIRNLGDVAVDDVDDSDGSTLTGLPTVMTSISDCGDGGLSNMKCDSDVEGSDRTGSAGRPVRGSIQVVTCLKVTSSCLELSSKVGS
jgi:hypothetical protein